MDVSARDEAIRRVDQRHGYTVEFAPDPDAHRAEYDAEEEAIRATTTTRGAVEADRATAERLLRYFRSYYMKPGEKALMTDEHIRWAAEEFVVANRPRGAVDR